MTTNSLQAEKLLKTAEENGLYLPVGFLTRFIPRLQHIQEAVASEKIGRLVCATAKRVTQ